MVVVDCHESGKGISCNDEKNLSVACHKDPRTCGWAKYSCPDYIFRHEEVFDGCIVHIPSDAIATSTGSDYVSWLEPNNKPVA